MRTCAAVIPAGGRIDTEFARKIGTSFRALAPLGPERTPALQIVVRALRDSGQIGHIVCVAPSAVAEAVVGVDTWLPAAENGACNILSGLAALQDPDAPAYLCASDLPLLTGDAVRVFAARCDDAPDLSVGLIGAKAYEAAFPEAPPSQFVWLRDVGPVTMSGLFRVRPSLLLRHETRLAQAFETRKSQIRMARLLGPHLLGRWMTRTLTLAAIRMRAEAILQGRVQILQTDVDPVLACDMDTADDYTYAQKFYAARLVS